MFDYKQRPVAIPPSQWAENWQHALGRDHDPMTCVVCRVLSGELKPTHITIQPPYGVSEEEPR